MLPNKNSFNNLGGELSDYSPLTDPTTDLSAFASNEARADTAAMTRTIIRAWVSFVSDGYLGSTPDGYADVSNTDFDAVYGNAIAFKPEIVKNSAGSYTTTFPTSIVDARGITQLINFQVGWCNVQDAGGFFANTKKISANIFDIYIFSAITQVLADPPAGTKTTLFVL